VRGVARIGGILALGLGAVAAALTPGAVGTRLTLYHSLVTTKISPVEVPAGWVVGRIQPMPAIDAHYLGTQAGTPFRSAVYASLERGRQSGVVTWFFALDSDHAADLVAKLSVGNGYEPRRPRAVKLALPSGSGAWVLTTGTGVANVGAIVIEAVPDLAHSASGDPAQAAALLTLGVNHLRDAERAIRR
jgi:hypothetical protein